MRLMQQKFLKISSLALLQIVIVGNLQVLPANAGYGAALPFLYLFAVIGFFIPCILMVAELATTHPQTGGAYIWCEKAFGAKAGFFAVCLLWLSNLLWYPTIFTLIAANFAYLFDASLAQNKMFVVGFGAILFWLFTGLNCMGVKFSSFTSVICSVLGVILPTVIIIGGGVMWLLSGKPLAIQFTHAAMFPDIAHLDNAGLLIGIVISLFGVELTAVHAGNVENPRRDYPVSLIISSVTVLALLLLSELAIAVIVPSSKLSLVTGLLDALVVLFNDLQFNQLLTLVLFLVLIGNIGSIAAWMLASTRGMYVAAKRNHLAPYLQKTNKYEAPVGILIFEAIIFTLISTVFLLFPNVTDAFWLLLDVASQLTILYYIILFISAIRLRYLPVAAPGFQIPGGRACVWVIMLIGIFTSLLAFMAGFIPPANLDEHDILMFRTVMIGGLVGALLIPRMMTAARK